MSEISLAATAPVAFAFDSHAVRTFTEDDGTIWFVARDVCAILGIAKPENAFARLDDDQKDTRTMGTLGGAQDMTVVNESGLYALAFTSRKPEAKQFARWVTGEVLPAIRRQGYYGGGAMAQMAQAMTQTQMLMDDLAARQAQTDDKINAILSLVDVAGKYIALLEEGQKPKRRTYRAVTLELETEIRDLLAQGMPGSNIARLLEVSEATVSLIKHGKWSSRKTDGGAL